MNKRLLIITLAVLAIIAVACVSRPLFVPQPGPGPRPTATPSEPRGWRMLMPEVRGMGADATRRGKIADSVPGYYCNSCGSLTCRTACAASVAVGAHNRFLWCEIMTSAGVYNTDVVTDWVQWNYDHGLRSVVGFNAKDERPNDYASSGSCTASSDGSPLWMLTPASIYDPLVNGTGGAAYYHLNYKDPQVLDEQAAMLQAVADAINSMADTVRNTVSIEAGIGSNGELNPARNYDAYPDPPLGWMDLNMYICYMAGHTWHPALGDQYCDDGGAPIPPSSESGASTAWLNDVIVPVIDAYGNAFSVPVNGADGFPISLMMAGQLVSSGERATACTACGGANFIDYANTEYDMGAKTSGVNTDMSDGAWEDEFGVEYRNWPNVLKLNWNWLLTGEHGSAMHTETGIGGMCCNTEKEFYWATLNGLDKGLSELHFRYDDINRAGAGFSEARDIFERYAGFGPDTTPDVWIVFRDTEGTYYPDGDNGASNGDPVGAAGCCRDWPNYEWYIYQTNPDPSQVKRLASLPATSYKSLSARSVDNTDIGLDVDDEWSGAGVIPADDAGCAAYTFTVDYYGNGTDTFRLSYKNYVGTTINHDITKTNTGGWTTATLSVTDAYMNNGLSGGADVMLTDLNDGEDIFHRVTIEETGCADATPTPTRTVTPTWTPGGPTATPTRTTTATPAATATITPQPLVCAGLPSSGTVILRNASGVVVETVVYASYDSRSFGAVNWMTPPAIGGSPVRVWATGTPNPGTAATATVTPTPTPT